MIVILIIAFTALFGIPLMFIIRGVHDHKVVKTRRRRKRDKELEAELGIGDEALVDRHYGGGCK